MNSKVSPLSYPVGTPAFLSEKPSNKHALFYAQLSASVAKATTPLPDTLSLSTSKASAPKIFYGSLLDNVIHHQKQYVRISEPKIAYQDNKTYYIHLLDRTGISVKHAGTVSACKGPFNIEEPKQTFYKYGLKGTQIKPVLQGLNTVALRLSTFDDEGNTQKSLLEPSQATEILIALAKMAQATTSKAEQGVPERAIFIDPGYKNESFKTNPLGESTLTKLKLTLQHASILTTSATLTQTAKIMIRDMAVLHPYNLAVSYYPLATATIAKESLADKLTFWNNHPEVVIRPSYFWPSPSGFPEFLNKFFDERIAFLNKLRKARKKTHRPMASMQINAITHAFQPDKVLSPWPVLRRWRICEQPFQLLDNDKRYTLADGKTVLSGKTIQTTFNTLYTILSHTRENKSVSTDSTCYSQFWKSILCQLYALSQPSAAARPFRLETYGKETQSPEIDRIEPASPEGLERQLHNILKRLDSKTPSPFVADVDSIATQAQKYERDFVNSEALIRDLTVTLSLIKNGILIQASPNSQKPGASIEYIIHPEAAAIIRNSFHWDDGIRRQVASMMGEEEAAKSSDVGEERKVLAIFSPLAIDSTKETPFKEKNPPVGFPQKIRSRQPVFAQINRKDPTEKYYQLYENKPVIQESTYERMDRKPFCPVTPVLTELPYSTYPNASGQEPYYGMYAKHNSTFDNPLDAFKSLEYGTPLAVLFLEYPKEFDADKPRTVYLIG